MSTNKTTNLNLHSWVGTDYPKRTEFNDNFGTIDNEIGILKKDRVSVLEYEKLKVATAEGYDWIPAIHGARDSLGTTGGTIVFTQKDFMIYSEMIIPDNIELFGLLGHKILPMKTGQTFITNSDKTNGNKKIRMKKICVDGINISTDTTAGSVHFDNVDDIKIKECEFLNMPKHGVFLNNVTNYRVDKNTLKAIGTAKKVDTVNIGCAIYVADTVDGWANNNYIEDVWQMGIFIQANTKQSSNVKAMGNTIKKCQDNGIRTQANVSNGLNWGDIHNCMIENNTLYDITIDAIRVNGNEQSVKNNKIFGISVISQAGIKSDGGIGHQIEGNQIKGVGVSIYFRCDGVDALDIKINFNIIKDSNAGGIQVTRIQGTENLRGFKLIGNESSLKALNDSHNISMVNVVDFTLALNHANNADKASINVSNCSDGKIQGNTAKNSGQAYGGYAGIYVNVSSRITITGNHCFDDQATKTQQTGIYIKGACDQIKHGDNMLLGNTTNEIYVDATATNIKATDAA